MKSPEAQKIIKKILDNLDHAGIITNTLLKDLHGLRPYAVEEKEPVIAKAIRLAYEHIETFDTFNIAIPMDEPIEDPEVDFELHDLTDSENEVDPKESMIYLISLLKDSNNPLNLQEIRDFNLAMEDYTG